MNLLEKLIAASKAIDESQYSDAATLVAQVESELKLISNSEEAINIRTNLGAVMIDLGMLTHDKKLVESGVKYAEEVLAEITEKELTADHYYNVANGYLSLWQMKLQISLGNDEIDICYQNAKKFFRKALSLAEIERKYQSQDSNAQLFVNYANCLDSVRRSIEAIYFYDQALKLNKKMGEALGNKAMVLYDLSSLTHGHEHLFLLEAHKLLAEALACPIPAHHKKIFEKYLEQVNAKIAGHKATKTEPYLSTSPVSPFHEFLQNFCVKYELYLTPSTLVDDKKNVVIGDPLFISAMVADINDDGKFERYITFLNEIKQDYVLARYLLSQSQYRSKVVDAVDSAILLYYPLDYSLYSGYIQMLKTSFRLAVDILDKIGFFIRDYCQVTSLAENDVTFRNLWAFKREPFKLRPELQGKKNPFLFALFDIAIDLKEGEYFEFLYERRNALTHRFLVIHEMMIPKDPNKDIPRVLLQTFTKECIRAMQITRAAIIYLILFFDFAENRASEKSTTAVIPGTPLDSSLRWVPREGE